MSACSPEGMPSAEFTVWAWVSLSLWIFMAVGACYALLMNHLPSQVVLLGALLTTVVCQLLKLIIGHSREYPACGVGDAMPSQHAMVSFFMCAYYSWVFYRYDTVSPRRWVIGRIVVGILYALLVSASRVRLRAGDAIEVTVGIVLGMTLAMVYVHTLTLMWSGALPRYHKED